MANEYNSEWFSTFLDPIPAENTRSEVDGIVTHIPLPEFRQLIDVCCGPGRHMAEFADRGYQVTGIDRDPTMVARARQRIPAATVLELDIRDLYQVEGPFDAAVNLWASFGHFDARTNDETLIQLCELLRPGGRLLLDLFHPGWFESMQGQEHRDDERGTRTVTEALPENRWRVTIDYDSGNRDVFEWEIFTPEQLIARVGKTGFEAVTVMTWWDQARPPSPEEARYQAVLEKL